MDENLGRLRFVNEEQEKKRWLCLFALIELVQGHALEMRYVIKKNFIKVFSLEMDQDSESGDSHYWLVM